MTRAVVLIVGLVAAIVAVAGCKPTPTRGSAERPSATAVVVGTPRWSVSVGPKGTIFVSFADCKVRAEFTYPNKAPVSSLTRCPAAGLMLVTPWGSRRRPIAISPDGAEFAVDWPASTIDPLDARTHKRGESGWQIDGVWLPRPIPWRPAPSDVVSMIAWSAAGRGIETEVVAGGPPPELVVEAFDVAGNALLGGATSELTLTIANRGAGTAYRVVALTRSSLPEVHDVQLSFGAIAPGARETRRVVVNVPATVTETDAMLVLEFFEANHNAPRNFSRRFAIRPLSTTPKLTLSCGLRGGDADREVDAGEIIHVVCAVGNDGAATATQVVVEINAGTAARTVVDRVAPASAVTVDLAVQVPRTARLDERIAMVVTAREPTYGRQVTATVEAVVRVPQVCPTGRLTREAYRAKRAELVAARDAGELTAAEFDSYDAELVGCLQ